MAVDTRDKRASAILIALPFRGLLPNPDGGVEVGDREMLAYLYATDDDAAPTTSTAAGTTGRRSRLKYWRTR